MKKISAQGYTHLSFLVRNRGKDNDNGITIYGLPGKIPVFTLNMLEPYFQRQILLDIRGYDELELSVEDPGQGLQFADVYLYDEQQVLDEGVTVLRFGDGGLLTAEQLAARYEQIAERPRYHFSPLSGWINDPNGLCRYKGYYHLFYQYYPFAAEWGNMYWGHAVSRDLLHWRQLSVALVPEISERYKGGAYSGSAVVADGGLRLYYTSHLEEKGLAGVIPAKYLPRLLRMLGKLPQRIARLIGRLNGAAVFTEHQQLALSTDGINFQLADVNPLIRSSTKPDGASRDFRDPKVFLDADGKYRMVLGSAWQGKPAVLLYVQNNDGRWEFDGVLYRVEDIEGRCIECPDFFRLGDKYVLIMSVLEREGVFYTRYRTGSYSNGKFTAQYCAVLDFGPSFYALQTFADGERRLGIAWMYSWPEEKLTARSGYAGDMTLPRELALDGNRLLMRPARETERLRSGNRAVFERCGQSISNDTVRLGDFSRSLEIKAAFSLTEGSSLELRLCSSVDNRLAAVVRYDAVKQQAGLEVTEQSRQRQFSEPLALRDGRLELHLFLDQSALETFWDDYRLSGSVRVFLPEGNCGLEIAAQGSAELLSIQIYEMESAWKRRGEGKNAGLVIN